MDIIQHLLDNHDHIFYLLGGVTLLVELGVLGFGSPLLFLGIAAFITGALTSLGIISGWEWEIFSLAALTCISATLLWGPLKKYQNSGGGPDTSSDMIGLKVTAATDITQVSGKIRYSAIDWNARISGDSETEQIEAKSLCIIVSVEGTTMLVKPI